MVSAENTDLGAGIDTHHGSGVSNVDDVNHIVDDQGNVSAGARSLRSNVLAAHHGLRSSLSLLYEREKVALALTEALLDGFNGILWKLVVLDYEIVEVVSKVVGAR